MSAEIKYRVCTTTSGGGAADWLPTTAPTSGWTGTFTPKTLKVSRETVASSNSGRTVSGDMYVRYVKDNIIKLEIELPPFKQTDTEYKSIIANIVGKVSWVKFYDLDGTARTEKMYCSSANGEYYSGVICNGLVQGVTFSWIMMG